MTYRPQAHRDDGNELSGRWNPSYFMQIFKYITAVCYCDDGVSSTYLYIHVGTILMLYTFSNSVVSDYT